MDNTFKEQVVQIIKDELKNYDFSVFNSSKEFEEKLNKLNTNPVITNLLYIFGINDDGINDIIDLVKKEALAKYNEVNNVKAKNLKPLWKQKFDGRSNAYDNTCGDTCSGDTCCKDECCDECDNTSNMYNADRYDVTNTSPVEKELEIYRTTNTQNINDDVLVKLNNIVNNYVYWFTQNNTHMTAEKIEIMHALLFDFAGYIYNK